MKIIDASYEILYFPEIDPLVLIEKIARVCYQSQEHIKDGSAAKLVKSLVENGHEAMIEHSMLSVLFNVDRGISHQLVRHRIASFAQESTRIDYDIKTEGITVIKPSFFKEGTASYNLWYEAMETAELVYYDLLECGHPPVEARCVLPNSLKTQIVITTNLREWRHILKLRTSKYAHIQIREVMTPLLAELKIRIPIIFDDIPCPTDNDGNQHLFLTRAKHPI